jgi:hypothetical protein
MVETFLRDFQARNPSVHVEVLNVDEREGIAAVNLYDVTQYPSIIAMADDGTLLNMWQGDELPLMDEVASYAYSGR